jgi:predicted dehydrogenase
LSKLRVGVIGCGEIATSRHLTAWRKVHQASVVAITDIDGEKAKEIAKSFHVCNWYTDYQKMIRSEALDIVDICTPTKFHKEQAIYACNHGIHVITEKPMASSKNACEEMISAFQSAKLKLTVCHTMLFYPAVLKVRKMIEDGNIGKVKMVKTTTPYCKVQPWLASQGGVLWEYGIHRVYLTLYLLSGDVEKVETKIYEPENPQDNFEIIIYTTTGIGSVHILKAIGNEEVSIYGSKKKIVFPSLPFNTSIIDKCRYADWKEVYLSSVLGSVKTLGGLTLRGIDYLLRGSSIVPHTTLIRLFADSVNGNSVVPILPEDGKRAVGILEIAEAEINAAAANAVT